MFKEIDEQMKDIGGLKTEPASLPECMYGFEYGFVSALCGYKREFAAFRTSAEEISCTVSLVETSFFGPFSHSFLQC